MSETISVLHRMVEESEPNICEITVMQDGEVCYEDYWHGFKSGDALNVMSVTKSVIALLAGIIENASQMKLIDFANAYLFEPLGIPEFVKHVGCSKEDQFDFLMNKNPRKHEWYTDPKNTVTAGWGLTLSATDMVRLGQMCLENGRFNGRKIISEKWIKEMTTPYENPGEKFGNMSYGYLWWITDKEKQNFAAIGDGGNVIYVNPEKKIVVGVAGTFKPRVFDRIEFIEQKVLPLALKR